MWVTAALAVVGIAAAVIVTGCAPRITRQYCDEQFGNLLSARHACYGRVASETEGNYNKALAEFNLGFEAVESEINEAASDSIKMFSTVGRGQLYMLRGMTFLLMEQFDKALDDFMKAKDDFTTADNFLGEGFNYSGDLIFGATSMRDRIDRAEAGIDICKEKMAIR